MFCASFMLIMVVKLPSINCHIVIIGVKTNNIGVERNHNHNDRSGSNIPWFQKQRLQCFKLTTEQVDQIFDILRHNLN